MLKIVDVWVPGRPRTKGSLGGGRGPDGRMVLADSPQSKTWRKTVSDTVIPLISDPVVVKDRTRWRLRVGWPKEGVAIAVSVMFVYKRQGESMVPIGRQWGDLDKLLRNVFDALQDAKVYKDDAQVQRVTSYKSFGDQEGAHIQVWELSEEDLAWLGKMTVGTRMLARQAAVINGSVW